MGLISDPSYVYNDLYVGEDEILFSITLFALLFRFSLIRRQEDGVEAAPSFLPARGETNGVASSGHFRTASPERTICRMSQKFTCVVEKSTGLREY